VFEIAALVQLRTSEDDAPTDFGVAGASLPDKTPRINPKPALRSDRVKTLQMTLSTVAKLPQTLLEFIGSRALPSRK